ncbi:hypothetical protein [Burkholderia alba]|uniref:hypothetical protein n=1 Tax=Burkholderia alba TaxID=2683677 RepID=UPI002B05AE6B|nr:hypothetical protein [Burkholderia alba]
MNERKNKYIFLGLVIAYMALVLLASLMPSTKGVTQISTYLTVEVGKKMCRFENVYIGDGVIRAASQCEK